MTQEENIKKLILETIQSPEGRRAILNAFRGSECRKPISHSSGKSHQDQDRQSCKGNSAKPR